MKCTSCGSKNREGLVFCENCGKPLEGEKPQSVKEVALKRCPNCLSEIQPGLKFCENCGKPLLETKSTILKQTTSMTCPNCHKSVKADLKFCENCGHPLVEVSADKDLRIKPSKENVIRESKYQGRFSNLSASIRANPYRAILAVLLIVGIIGGLGWGLDKLGNSVSRNQADSMARGVVVAVFPQLADVQPSINDFKQSDHNVVSYNYSKEIEVPLPDGNITKTTAGLIINVDRKTGAINLVQWP
jgi:hypothetical protein